ncbi:MAG: hypothetical protein E7220_06245 [Clostridiales bacterium]|nr:hypothetical protein [Clostridiales bacterium]
MKMTEILEKDKERLLTELSGAGTAEKAVKVLENETDKLLLRFNEQCDSEKERDSAAHMMQALRLSLPLIDSTGETKVWESGGREEQVRKTTIPFILLTIAAIGLCVYGLLPLFLASMNSVASNVRTEVVTRGIFVVAGVIAAFFAGSLSRKSSVRKDVNHHVEIKVDPAKIYRSYRNALLSVDQSLEEVAAAERWSKREQAGNIDGRKATTPEIELFADLLSAYYSGDPEYALEKIGDIKYYLHRQQIEAVDYSEETKQYFDMMPGNKTGTIRPALVADGGLLKKGLASSGR